MGVENRITHTHSGADNGMSIVEEASFKVDKYNLYTEDEEIAKVDVSV